MQNALTVEKKPVSNEYHIQVFVENFSTQNLCKFTHNVSKSWQIIGDIIARYSEYTVSS